MLLLKTISYCSPTKELLALSYDETHKEDVSGHTSHADVDSIGSSGHHTPPENQATDEKEPDISGYSLLLSFLELTDKDTASKLRGIEKRVPGLFGIKDIQQLIGSSSASPTAAIPQKTPLSLALDIMSRDPKSTADTLFFEAYGERQVDPTQTEKARHYLNIIFNHLLADLRKTNPDVLSLGTFEEGSEHLTKLIKVTNNIVAAMTGVIDFPEQEFTRQTTRDYHDLKGALIHNLHDKGDLLNVREENLFKWCYVVIQALVFDPLNVFIAEHTQSLLAKLGVLLAIYDTRIDDMADLIQDQELTTCFTQIPQADQRLQAKETIEAHHGIFIDFFNQTADLWDTIVTELEQLIETSYVDSNDPTTHLFKAHINELMQVMNYSVEMNTSKKLPDDFNTMLAQLAPNMMTKLLFDFQLMALEKSAPDCVKSILSEKRDAFFSLFREIEKSFHIANCFATFKRKINEEDLTNAMFKLAEIWATAQFDVFTKRTELHDFKTFLEEEILEYTGPDEKIPPEITLATFLDLFHYTATTPPLLQREKEIKQTILRKIVSDPSVVKRFFHTWKRTSDSISTQVDSLIEHINHVLEDSDNLTVQSDLAKFADALHTFKENNELFLISYCLFEGVKGAT